MLTSILRTFFIGTLLLNTISFAEEGDIERLMVPETQEAPSSEVQMGDMNPEDNNMLEEIQEQTDMQEEIPNETNPNEEEVQEQTTANNEESPEEVNPTPMNESESSEASQPDMNAPSSEDLEAKHAEEAELREVGAGEEPSEQ